MFSQETSGSVKTRQPLQAALLETYSEVSFKVISVH